MRCPFCKKHGDRVLDSRTNKEGNSIRRRRQCLNCGRRYTTHEFIEMNDLMVVKKDGRRESFDRQKLLNGIKTACKKLPISTEEIESITNGIEIEIQNSLKNEITSRDIGEMVMDSLFELNHVAYVRFSSVYREFTDTDQFIMHLRELRQQEMGRKKKE